MVSGGFDPLHTGHVRMFAEAAKHGTVIVALNSDAWLQRKKKHCLLAWSERAEILLALRHVQTVVSVDDRDDTVCPALVAHRPTYFGNGGDRGRANTPEAKLCAELGITCLWGLGGDNGMHSSELMRRAVEAYRG